MRNVFLLQISANKLNMNTFIIALLSVALVVAIGWCAGRFKMIEPHLDAAFNIFILKFSLPILLFYATATADLKKLFDLKMNGAFLLALIGMFVLTLLFNKLLLGKTIHQSAETAFVCSYPNTAFLGIPLLTSIVGMSAMIPIVVSNIIVGIFIIPTTLMLIEIGLFGREKLDWRHIVAKIIKTPLISMSFLGTIIALTGFKLPAVIDHGCKMVGATAPGVSLFTLGLIMSRFSLRLSKMTVLNIFLKNLLHPILMIFIVKAIGIDGQLAKELIILCAMPTAITATIFSVTFAIDPDDNVSSTIIGTMFSLVSMFAFMAYLKF